MEKRLILAVILLIVGSLTLVPAHAESKKKVSKSNKTQKKTIEKYDETAFDLTLTSLPLSYKGHDLMKLYITLNNRKNIIKNEFETTEQFNNRLANEQTKPTLGKLTVEDIYAIMVEPKAEYDADNKLLNLYITNWGVQNGFNGLKTDIIGIKARKISSKRDSYIGSNAFGATTEVSSSSDEEVVIALDNQFNQFDWNKRNDRYTSNEYFLADIKLSLENLAPETAKEQKDHLRVLCIIKLNKPYVSKGTSYSPATYDAPSSSHSEYYNVNSTVTELWIYNFKTGNVLKKIKIPSKLATS